MTPDLRAFIDAHQLGGVFLSRETCNIDNGTVHDPEHCGFPPDPNPDTPAQVAGLTNELQKAACDATGGSIDGTPYCLPLFVSIDHEGDDRPSTRLLNRFTPIPEQHDHRRHVRPRPGGESGLHRRAGAFRRRREHALRP